MSKASSIFSKKVDVLVLFIQSIKLEKDRFLDSYVVFSDSINSFAKSIITYKKIVRGCFILPDG